MKLSRRLREGRSLPLAILAMALLIVVGGLFVIARGEASYSRAQQGQAEGYAEVLAASATAAVDFGDTVAAQEAVDSFRVNRTIRWLGIYDRGGQAVATYARAGTAAPSSLTAAATAPQASIRVDRPIIAAGQRIGTVLLEMDREPSSRRLSRWLLLGALILVAALVVAGLGIAQAQLRDANRKLSQRAEALAQANILLEDQMEQRAEAEDQLRQSQKMQALGQLTGGIAHDFNNLLTVIQGSADILTRDDIDDRRRKRFADAILQAANSASALTSQLLAFARRQPLRPEHIDINALITNMRDLLDRTLGERVTIELQLRSERCQVEADLAQLQSAILNIASNARDAMPGGGTLTIGTSDSDGEAGKMLELSISDTGGGMDEETRRRVFEPFFTTKPAGKGTGLGLSQVYGFAEQSGGTVRIDSNPGNGTKITIVLPCALSDRPAEVPVVLTEAKLSPCRILVVEDNEQVGAFAETLLADQGHAVSRASSGEEALEMVRESDFDIVFSDVVMPGMGGIRLAEQLSTERPALPVILATGYSEELARGRAIGRPFILKPYRLTTLLEAMAKVLPAAENA
nr:ATP-binding protein [uncultured Sphingomonas sp.]